MTRLLCGLHDGTHMLACSNYAISSRLTFGSEMAHDSYKATRFVSLTKNKGPAAVIINGKSLKVFRINYTNQSDGSRSENGTFRNFSDAFSSCKSFFELERERSSGTRPVLINLLSDL
jgi:hypothetical protein